VNGDVKETHTRRRRRPVEKRDEGITAAQGAWYFLEKYIKHKMRFEAAIKQCLRYGTKECGLKFTVARASERDRFIS
jgi:hypothetical protein